MNRLKELLHKIDGKGYKAYKQIQGTYDGPSFQLHVDYVQGDPFASPSRVRIVIPTQHVSSLTDSDYNTPWRKVAVEDFIARQVAGEIQMRRWDGSRGKGSGASSGRAQGSGKSGLIFIDAPGQEVLVRSAVVAGPTHVEIRLSVGLPAAGRTILGRQAEQILCHNVPSIITKSVIQLDRQQLIQHVQLSDQQQTIREYIQENGYVSFIGNGSILPRESGVSNRPLRGRNVVPFQSPSFYEVEIPLPHRDPIRGMAIPQGITLIVGGGYHGKTTLLKAIERGVYNHTLGDGREYVITNDTAVKIRAEDGRRVEKVNITPFITNLPFGKDTSEFSTEDASGSTSQATNIMEALEVGTQLLLIDEDTSATNFMIRDARMQKLVHKGKEPITPFVDKVRQLFEQHHVSTILVIGGSGDYFQVADHVIMMDEYTPTHVTDEAHQIAAEIHTGREEEGGKQFGSITPRTVLPETFHGTQHHKFKMDAKGLSTIMFGRTKIDLSLVEQLVDPSQTRAIADILRWLGRNDVNEHRTLKEAIERVYARIEENGIDSISPYFGSHPGDLALPRKYELAAALNRLHELKVR